MKVFCCISIVLWLGIRRGGGEVGGLAVEERVQGEEEGLSSFSSGHEAGGLAVGSGCFSADIFNSGNI